MDIFNGHRNLEKIAGIPRDHAFAERPRISLSSDEVIVLGVADVLEGQVALVLAGATRKRSRVWPVASVLGAGSQSISIESVEVNHADSYPFPLLDEASVDELVAKRHFSC